MENPISELNQKQIEQLANDAKKVLDENWTGTFTRPSRKQYPHQWSWDAVFIAMGYTHYHQDRAEQEFRHLLSGQWENGMIPQIVFNTEKEDNRYFPGPEFWQTERSENAPEVPKTSGICQPPVHATGLLHLIEYAPNRKQALDFAAELFPKLREWHNYLYHERDPNKEGLVYIRHPWESGQDNSPIWDDILNRLSIDTGQLPDYQRKDEIFVDPEERPSNEDYNKYVYLVEFFRNRNYDEKRIFEDNCPFLVQDVLFNTLLAKASRDLAKIAGLIGEDGEPFRVCADETVKAMNEKLWNEEESMYTDFDLQASRNIKARVLAGFLPLFAKIPDNHREQKIFRYLNTHCFCQMTDTCFPAPSYDRNRSDYSSKTYWRGPVWINMNWLLANGLKQYGYDDYVKQVRNSMIQLPFKSGFREYYDTNDGKGYGTDHFSWTAALFLDVIYRENLLEQ